MRRRAWPAGHPQHAGRGADQVHQCRRQRAGIGDVQHDVEAAQAARLHGGAEEGQGVVLFQRRQHGAQLARLLFRGDDDRDPRCRSAGPLAGAGVLDRPPGALRRPLPAETGGTLQAVAREFGTPRVVGQYFPKTGGDARRRAGIEQRVGPAQHFGNRRVVGGDHRGAALHGFQHRQAEAFVQRREHEHGAGVVQRAQARIVDPAGNHQLVGAEAGTAHLFAEVVGVADLVHHQLVAAAQRGIELRIGLQHAVEVLAVVAISRVQHERPADAERLHGRGNGFTVGLHVEIRVRRGADVDHPLGGDTEDADRIVARRLGNRQEQVDVLQAGKAPPEPVGIGRRRIEVLGREQQRNEVVEHRHAQSGGQDRVRLGRHARLAPAFEGAGAEGGIGAHGLVGRMDHGRRCTLLPGLVGSGGAERRMGVRRHCSRRQERTECMTQLGRAVGVQAVGEQAQLMLAARGGHRLGKRQAVASDAAQARSGLARKEIENQAQTVILNGRGGPGARRAGRGRVHRAAAS